MTAKRKVLTAISIAVVFILAGIAILFVRSFKGATTLTHETPQGQRAITLPEIPGMEKVAEEKGECFQKVDYNYTLTKADIAEHIKNQLKSTFLGRGWQLEQETIELLSFTTKEQGELERLNLRLGFEEGRGTFLTLEYQWPPCSGEEVKGAQTQNRWSVFHGDAARSGYSDSPAPSQPKVLWQLTVGQVREIGADGFETNWPVISGNKVFFGNIAVFALDLKNGQILWHYKDKSVPFFPNGLAAADNKVFASVNDSGLIKNMRTGFIYALDAKTGKFLWKIKIAAAPSHSLPLVAEGKIFVGDDSGTLNALDTESGKILWQKKLVADGSIHSSPAYADGLVFVGTEGDARYHDSPPNPSSVFALEAETGKIAWQFPIDYTTDRVNLIHSTPAVLDGVVYAGSENGWFYALDAVDGCLIWKKELAKGREMVGPSAAAGLGYGKVFVGTWAGKFLALDQKTGETVWEFSYEGKGTDSSPVVADGKVCLGAHEGYFYCLDAETGKVLWQEKLGGPSAALANGILIVPNALAGDNVDNPQTPVLVAFADEGQAALELPEAPLALPKSKLPLLLVIAGAGILVVCGFWFLKMRKK